MLTCNKDAGFIAETTGLNDDILVTPFAPNDLEIEEIFDLDKSILDNDGRTWYDPTEANCGSYGVGNKRKPVLFDVDICLTGERSESPAVWDGYYGVKKSFEDMRVREVARLKRVMEDETDGGRIRKIRRVFEGI